MTLHIQTDAQFRLEVIERLKRNEENMEATRLIWENLKTDLAADGQPLQAIEARLEPME